MNPQPPTPPVLDYASRGMSRGPTIRERLAKVWRGVVASIRAIRDAGPWFVRPSLRTLLAAALLVGCGAWLSRTCLPWRRVARVEVPPETFETGPFVDDQALITHSPDGKLVQLLDLPTGKVRLAFPRGAFRWFWTRTSPAGQRYLAAYDGDAFAAWDLATGKQTASRKPVLSQLFGRAQGVIDADLSPAGRWLVTLNDRGEVVLWDTNDLLAVGHFRYPGNVDITWGASVRFAPDARHFVVRFCGGVLIGRVHPFRLAVTMKSGRNLPAFGLFGGSDELIGGDLGGRTSPTRAAVWDCETGKRLRPFSVAHAVEDAAPSPDGRRVALGGGGRVSVCDVATGSVLSAWSSKAWEMSPYFGDTNRPPRPIAWLGNDHVITTDAFADEVLVQRAADGRRVARLPVDADSIPLAAAASPDGTYVAVEVSRGRADVWRRPADDLDAHAAGMLARPAWWATIVASLALAYTAHADGRRAGRRAPSPRATRRVALGLTTLGAACVAVVVAWLAMGGWTAVELRLLRRDHAGIGVGLFAFLAGVGLAAGGKGWKLISITLLLAAITVIPMVVMHLATGGPNRLYLLDRAFDAPTWSLVTAWLLLLAAAIAALGALFRATPVANLIAGRVA